MPKLSIKPISALCLTAAAFSAPQFAHAQSGGADARQGAYVNIGAAILSVDANLDGLDVAGNTVDLGDETVSTFVINGRLGYRFNKYIAAEIEGGFGLGGDDVSRSIPIDVDVLGPINVDVDADVELNNYGAGFIRGILPVSDQFDIFVRGGYGFASAEASATATTALLAGASVSDSISDDIDGFVFGAGAEYHINEKHGLRGDFSTLQGDTDVLFFAASYSYKF